MSSNTKMDKDLEKQEAATRTMKHLQEGKLPNNAELVQGIDTFNTKMVDTKPKLSVTGQRASDQVGNILQTAKEMLETKNEGEHFQKAVYHMYSAGKDQPIIARFGKIKDLIFVPNEDIKGIQAQAKKNVDSIITIIKLCIMSPEFRQTLNEFFNFFSSLAHKQSKQLEEKYQQGHGRGPAFGSIDQSSIISNEGATKSYLEKKIKHEPNPNAKANFNPNANPNVNPNVNPNFNPNVNTNANPNDNLNANPNANPNFNPNANPNFNPNVKSNANPNANPNFNPNVKSNANWLEPHEHYQWIEKEGKYSLQRSASDGGEQSESQEQEEKLITLIIDLLQRIHSYPEFSNSVDYLSNSLGNLQSNWRESFFKLEEALEVPDSELAKSHREASKREIIEFIEHWIGQDYSLDPLIHSVMTIKDIVQRDPELQGLFHDLRAFFTKSARDDNYVNNKERVREDARDLIHRARSQLRNKHRDEFQRLKRELLFLNESIQNDKSMLTLRDEVKDLVNTLTTDSKGNMSIKPELLSDAQLLIQALFETIKYLPLPPIEREDENGTFRLENIVLNVTDILPSQIKLSTQLDASGQNHNSIEIRLKQIRAHLRNVKFYMDKRSGFPHIKETGFADIDLSGKNGMDLFISVRPQLPSIDSKHNAMFHINKCTCSISKLRLRLRDTKHDFLYKLLSPVINAIARKRIETMVQDNIANAIKQLDRAVTNAREQGAVAVKKAKEKAEKAQHKEIKREKGYTFGKDPYPKDTYGTYTKDSKDTHATHGKEHTTQSKDARTTHGTHAPIHETKAHH
jgi:transcriptional regulator with XRE-family HTH domain